MEKLLLFLNFDGGPFLDWLFWHISGKVEWVWLYLIMLWMIWRRTGWRGMVLALLIIVAAVGAADQIAGFFKAHCPRLRPTRREDLAPFIHTVRGYRGGTYGTVSAHASTTLSIALIGAYIIKKRVFTCLILLWAALVGYSRVYLAVHFPLDVLLGWATGLGVGTLGIAAWRWLWPKATRQGSSR